MSLLTVLQKFCSRTGLPVPAAAIGIDDAQITQLAGLADEVLEDLCQVDWQDLTKEAIFTTVAGEDQGSIHTIAPDSMLRIKAQTIYNRSLRLPIFGPITDSRWQSMKALPTTGPFYKYRIRGGRLLFNPVGIAGHTCAFEYVSGNIVQHTDGSYSPSFTADSDVLILTEGEKLLLAGLRWKWRSEKGMDYAEEFRRYEELKLSLTSTDATKPVLSLDGGDQNLRPGIWTPAGNWNQP